MFQLYVNLNVVKTLYVSKESVNVGVVTTDLNPWEFVKEVSFDVWLPTVMFIDWVLRIIWQIISLIKHI